jgi:hypothetical protein
MARPSQVYYEHYKRQHRVLGAYLLVHCWHSGYDAILVSRETLACFHELKKFTAEHLSWLQEDIKPYFPNFWATTYTRIPSKFHSIGLSRTPFPSAFGEESLSDVQRAAKWRSLKFKIAALSELNTTKTALTERDAVSFLVLMASGLAVPAIIHKSRL